MKKRVITVLLMTGISLFFIGGISCRSFAQGADWKVWVKTSPCTGRFDWITVSKQDPTSPGLSFYTAANIIFPGTGCTTSGCSFKDATRIANSLRPSPVFAQYCCQDYSVWKNSSTGKMSIVQGKSNTAGSGWQLVQASLCCEEAEAVAGMPGACSSGADQITPPPPPKPVQCYPGSHAQYNKQTKRTECFCDAGLVWNSEKTACVQPAVQCYPGSHAEYNKQTKRTECFCDPGLVWNNTKTACVKPVPCYPGSHPAVNPVTNLVECYCDDGLVWNSTQTACIKGAVQCYPGSHAEYNKQTKRTECFCDPGLVWNSTKTACEQPPVKCYPGSHATFNPTTNRVECFCDDGLVWNSTKTACIKAKANNNGTATWTLVSVTMHPDKPMAQYKYNQGGTAHMDLYNGDKADFQWTPPPAQFGSAGFTVSISASASPAPNNRMSLVMGVTATGLTSDTPADERYFYVKAPEGPLSGQKSVQFRPSGTPQEIVVEVGMMWGELSFSYKYKKE